MQYFKILQFEVSVILVRLQSNQPIRIFNTALDNKSLNCEKILHFQEWKGVENPCVHTFKLFRLFQFQNKIAILTE